MNRLNGASVLKRRFDVIRKALLLLSAFGAELFVVFK